VLQGCWRSRSDFQFRGLRSGERTALDLINVVLEVDVPGLVLESECQIPQGLLCPFILSHVPPAGTTAMVLTQTQPYPASQSSTVLVRFVPSRTLNSVSRSRCRLTRWKCLRVGRTEVERSICYKDMRMTCQLFLVWVRRLRLTQQRRKCDGVKEAWTMFVGGKEALPHSCRGNVGYVSQTKPREQNMLQKFGLNINMCCLRSSTSRSNLWSFFVYQPPPLSFWLAVSTPFRIQDRQPPVSSSQTRCILLSILQPWANSD